MTGKYDLAVNEKPRTRTLQLSLQLVRKYFPDVNFCFFTDSYGIVDKFNQEIMIPLL